MFVALTLAAISSTAHAQVVPSSSGGGLVAGVPAAEHAPAPVVSWLRFAVEDLAAVRQWFSGRFASFVSTAPTATVRVRYAVRERDARGAR